MPKKDYEFEFSPASRQAIHGALERFHSDRVQYFIGELERHIAYWRRSELPGSNDPAEDRRHLALAAKNIASANYHLANLSPGAKLCLYSALLSRLHRDDEEPGGGGLERLKEFGEHMREFMAEVLQPTLCEMQGEISQTQRDNASKDELVRAAAKTYHQAFQKKPSSTPGSPFMAVIGVVADALEMKIGRDAVLDALNSAVQ